MGAKHRHFASDVNSQTAADESWPSEAPLRHVLHYDWDIPNYL